MAEQPARAHGRGAVFAGEVGADLARVERAWRESGRVSVLRSRLVVRGASVPVALPAEALAVGTPSCATLLVLAAKNAVFSLTFAERGADARRDFPLSSSLGLIELSRCGPRKAALSGISIETGSPRAVISLLLVLGDAPAPSSASLLLGRQAGDTAEAPQLGPRPMASLHGDRKADKRRLRALEQPSELTDGVLSADSAGNATARITLAPGCHTLDVLDVGSEAGHPDVDARLVQADGETLALDASVSPDAALSFCLGEPSTLTLDVRGVSAEGPVAWVRSSWPLPEGLPVDWGPRARGRLAEALHAAGHSALSAHPIAKSLGVQGSTRLTAAVQPGSCYVAAVAALDRMPERLGLGLRAGGRTHQSRSRKGRSSAVVSACASGPVLTVEVDSLGAGASWILGLWEVESPGTP